MDFPVTILRPNCPAIFAAAGPPPDVALDNASAPTWDIDGGTTAAGSLLVGSLSNGILIAVVSWEDLVAGAASVSGVSSDLAGAFTHLPLSAVPFVFGAIDIGADIWYKLSPSSGTHTVTATMNEATGAVAVALLSAANVSQSAPFGTVATNIDTSGTPTSTDVDIASAAGDLCLAHLLSTRSNVADTGVSAGAQRWEVAESSFFGAITLGATLAAIGGTTRISFTMLDAFATQGVALKKA